ncbi:hypothetical protein E4U10_007980, partial [Claviceps purpurea]
MAMKNRIISSGILKPEFGQIWSSEKTSPSQRDLHCPVLSGAGTQLASVKFKWSLVDTRQ